VIGKTIRPPGRQHSSSKQSSTDARRELERQRKNLDSRFPRRETTAANITDTPTRDMDNISLPDPITGKYGDLEYRTEYEDSTPIPFLELKQEYVEFGGDSPPHVVKEEGECSDSE
jgi:hypothetical protein